MVTEEDLKATHKMEILGVRILNDSSQGNFTATFMP